MPQAMFGEPAGSSVAPTQNLAMMLKETIAVLGMQIG